VHPSVFLYSDKCIAPAEDSFVNDPCGQFLQRGQIDGRIEDRQPGGVQLLQCGPGFAAGKAFDIGKLVEHRQGMDVETREGRVQFKAVGGNPLMKAAAVVFG